MNDSKLWDLGDLGYSASYWYNSPDQNEVSQNNSTLNTTRKQERSRASSPYHNPPSRKQPIRTSVVPQPPNYSSIQRDLAVQSIQPNVQLVNEPPKVLKVSYIEFIIHLYTIYKY